MRTRPSLNPGPIPDRFAAPCHFGCGRPVDTRQEGVFQWTCGWVMQRSGGGGHGVTSPERHNKWAHGDCVTNSTKGGPGQSSMF